MSVFKNSKELNNLLKLLRFVVTSLSQNLPTIIVIVGTFAYMFHKDVPTARAMTVIGLLIGYVIGRVRPLTNKHS